MLTKYEMWILLLVPNSNIEFRRAVYFAYLETLGSVS